MVEFIISCLYSSVTRFSGGVQKFGDIQREIMENPKKIPATKFPITLLSTMILEKSETPVCDYSVEVLFKSQISEHHLLCVLNGIFLKSVRFRG